jgi:hypothetical protein
MTDWQMVDPTGAMIVELRDYMASVATAEPTSRRGLAAIAVGDAVYGDTKAEDRLAPYVILRRAGPARRQPRAPVVRFRYQADCYGSTEAEATTVWGLVSDWLSARGPRRRSPGVAIYLSIEELGGQARLDPDTEEPLETGFYFVSVPLAQAAG